MKQTTFTLLLAMLLSLVGLQAFAVFDNSKKIKVGNLYYCLDSYNQQAQVTIMPEGKYTGYITIPSSITYQERRYSVTSIGNSAFYKCSGLTSITIPNSVTSIGYSAFSGCSGLTSVTIPNSVTTIGDFAFSNCSDLTSVTIPNSVTNIGQSAFSNCSGLTSIKVESGNTVYDSRNDCNAIIEKATNTLVAGCKNTIIPNSVTSIGYSAFSGCSGLTSVTIPNSVTSIDGGAFSYCSGLTSISIPNSVTSIGSSAFYNCRGLTSITIPESVTSIGSDAFWCCTGLTSVTIGNGVTSIGGSAFYSCSSLTSITIPNSVTSIGYAAFGECSGLTSITIGSGVTSIGSDAFYNCSGLTSVTLNSNAIISKKYTDDNNIKSIFGKQVKEYVIGEGVTSIGELAFYECSGLTSVTIPNSVTSIGKWAFAFCSGLTSIIIPNSVTSIGYGAFEECSGLESLTIGSGVTSYGNSAFDCSKLTSVTVLNPIPVAIQYVFTNQKNATLYVPQGSKEAYEAADYWKEFKEIIEIEVSGIDQIMTDEEGKAKIFTLDGRRINKPQKGINIIGGKKVVVK